ncbi:response regulator [Planctomycetales bacterium ZRK34]|nr:response regulator [Planctomycetales bacterium ZRK34]
MKIMLIEDDPVHARLICRAFGTHDDHEVIVVGDGEQALEALNGQPPHPNLVLMDLCLPTIDGCDVLKALRDCEATRHLPVIMISTSDRPEDINRCYDCGANAYVVKPADFNGLSEKLRSIRDFWLDSACLPEPAPSSA